MDERKYPEGETGVHFLRFWQESRDRLFTLDPMFLHTLPALLETMPPLGILESSSRFLLTLGVGLFIAYAVCMLGANLLGVAHRQVSTLTKRNGTTESFQHEATLGNAAPIGDQAGTPVALKREVL